MAVDRWYVPWCTGGDLTLFNVPLKYGMMSWLIFRCWVVNLNGLTVRGLCSLFSNF